MPTVTSRALEISRYYRVNNKHGRRMELAIVGYLTIVQSDLFTEVYYNSVFIWEFWKLPFPEHLGKYFIKIGEISATIHEIGKIKAIF